jgi:hypothetical protein
MINSGLATFFVVLVLGLVAVFGYYRGFMALVMRRVALGSGRYALGRSAILLGLIYLAGAIAASAVATLFYFSQNS